MTSIYIAFIVSVIGGAVLPILLPKHFGLPKAKQ